MNEQVINKHHKRKGAYGVGDGVSLATYLTEQTNCAKIEAYEDIHQEDAKLGSLAMFDDLNKEMINKTYVLIYIFYLKLGSVWIAGKPDGFKREPLDRHAYL